MTLKRIIAQGTNPGYITNVAYLQSLHRADAGTTTNFFNTAISFVISDDPTTSGMSWSSFTTTPMLKYTSYAQFVSDLSRNAITYPFSWLMYDNENWVQTPRNEMDAPWTYMTSFVSLAHAHGYKVMLAPARDLGNDVTSSNPRRTGETLDAWYLRTYVAAWAAYAGADIVEIQAQVDTVTGGFVSFFNSALAQIRAHSACPVWVGVSTIYGTAAQMAAAAQSVSADGYWLNASSSTIARADSFLRLMPAPLGSGLAV